MIEAVKVLLREDRKAPSTSMNWKLEAVKLGKREWEAKGAAEERMGKKKRRKRTKPIQFRNRQREKQREGFLFLLCFFVLVSDYGGEGQWVKREETCLHFLFLSL